MNSGISVQETGALPLADLFCRSQASPSTQIAYRWDLTKWFTWLEVSGGRPEAPTLKNAVDFKEYLASTFAGRTAQRIFNTCRVFYRFLGGFNPFQTLKSPRATKNRTPIVPDDLLVMKMLELCDDVRDKFILALLLNGLRRAEVPALQSDSIQWSATYGCDIIRVIGKGDKERLVPATLEASKALRKYEIPSSGPLFPKLTPRAVEYVVEKWSVAAGKKISPHKLRHFYATDLVRNGANILGLSRLLGHESISTTQIYVHLDIKDLVSTASLSSMNLQVIDEEKGRVSPG
jgi:site-specific recombinase XerD